MTTKLIFIINRIKIMSIKIYVIAYDYESRSENEKLKFFKTYMIIQQTLFMVNL